MELSRTSVFLDFDGTISTADIGKYMLERLAAPEWVDLDRRYGLGEIGSRECVGDQWLLIARDEARARAVAREVPLDPAFEPLVHALWDAGAEVTVVSDGFGFYVEEVCDRVGVDCYTNRIDWDAWRLEFPFADLCCACSTCGTCKQAPIKDARRRGRHTVIVGDGTSDRKAVLQAHTVFAKDGLAAWCDDAGVAYQPFCDLADVRAALGL